MSLENVEAWRASIEDFLACAGAAEWEGWLIRAAELWDPQIEWDASAASLPDVGGVYRGREAVVGFWRDWLAAWGALAFDYKLVDAVNRVVMLVEQRTRGRSSGIEVPVARYAQVATFRNGLMVHWKIYASHSEALEAVGFSE